MATWQWVNYLRHSVEEPLEPLMLNLDETAVAYYHGDQRGNLVAYKRARRDGPEPVQRVSRRQLRGCLTHVAIIADRADVQAVLPQVLLGNESMLPARVVRAMEGTLPPNVIVKRAKSSWTNIPTMVWVLDLVARALEPWRATHQPILLMDCARQHLHESVARAAKRRGLWLAFVPAGLTWLLQPCDTHVFLRYKRHLRRGYAAARSTSEDGRVTVATWLQLIAATIREVLQGNRWQLAFVQTGLDGTQAGLSSYVCKELGPLPALPAPSDEPTAAVVEAVLPRGARAPLAALLRHVGAPRAPALLDAALHELLDEPEPPQAGVWAGRLRSSAAASASLPPALPRPPAEASPVPGTPPPLPPPPGPPPGHSAHVPRGWPLPMGLPSSPRPRAPGLLAPPPAAPSSQPASSSEGPISRRTRSRTSASARETSAGRPSGPSRS